MQYDYLIVGAGLFGSVFAREMTNAGANCLVVEKRNHIAGNCFTRNDQDIQIHQYGPHIFHTSNKKIWNYINKWGEFNHFSYRPKVYYKEKIYSFPINLMTLYQLWGVSTPQEAAKKLKEVKISINNPSNLEEWALSQIGTELYEKFVYGYTKKQWGKDPKDLPSFIIKRLPIRLTYDDNYYNDCYQGVPKGGYTKIFEKLLENIPVETQVDYISNRTNLDSLAKKVVYTGPIDEFFNCNLGTLEWRSLKFKEETYNIPDYQGNAAINYTEEKIPYTRIIEHKHFNFGQQDHTIISKEYPQPWDKSKEKFYPMNDATNNALFNRYKSLIDKKKFIFGGRLANYKYYDMHQVIAQALTLAKKER